LAVVAPAPYLVGHLPSPVEFLGEDLEFCQEDGGLKGVAPGVQADPDIVVLV